MQGYNTLALAGEPGGGGGGGQAAVLTNYYIFVFYNSFIFYNLFIIPWRLQVSRAEVAEAAKLLCLPIYI